MSVPDPLAAQIPSAWSVYVPILTGLARGMLTMLGGVGVTWAQTVSGSQIETAISAAMVLAGLVWSAYQKILSARASHVSSVASANASAERTVALGVAAPVVVETKAAP